MLEKTSKIMATIKTFFAKNCYVMLLVSYRGIRFQVSTGMTSSSRFEGMVFPPTERNHKAKTSRLARMVVDCEEYMLIHPTETTRQIKDSIKRIITGKEKASSKTLCECIEEFAATKKRSTSLIYMTTLKRVAAFDDTSTLSDINKTWLERYKAHEEDRGRKLNGIGIDLRNIRAVFNWAIDNEQTTNYPFRKFSIKSERRRHLFLSADEMNELAFYEVEEYQEMYRDLFILGFMLIGINISDLLELPAKCIKGGRLQYRRNKTGRLYDVKVEPEAMDIINRYKGKDHLLRFLDDGVNVRTMNRLTNDALKRIGRVEIVKNKRGAMVKKQIIPLHQDIVWYTARRSWATIAAEMDIPKEVIGKALGHSEWDNTTTDIYIDFNYKKVDVANRRVIDWVVYGKR